MNHRTLIVSTKGPVCRIRLDRPDADNAIDATMIAELGKVLADCAHLASPVSIVVIDGGADVFCAGGDFAAVSEGGNGGDPAPLYDVWQVLAEGPFVSIALVQGRANAGGVGFVAACDLVIAAPGASFALSELLFGLYPACVLPFLIQRTGRQAAHRMTLMTKPVSAQDAHRAGLVDMVVDDPETALQREIPRLARLQKPALERYKSYMAQCSGDPTTDRAAALSANRQMFSDPDVIAGIRRYTTDMKFPWEP